MSDARSDRERDARRWLSQVPAPPPMEEIARPFLEGLDRLYDLTEYLEELPWVDDEDGKALARRVLVDLRRAIDVVVHGARGCVPADRPQDEVGRAMRMILESISRVEDFDTNIQYSSDESGRILLDGSGGDVEV